MDDVGRKRRAAEIEHERELARIRAESHALVWTGPTEELVAAITHWYESGWITVESLQAALQKASIHFVKPDGSPAIKPAIARTAALPSECTETNPRLAFVMPLLEQHGWSILDWAIEAGVDHGTAMDYLANRRKTFRSSRLKLAGALKISVDQLPK